jgi:hypothetical protein
LKLVPAVQEKIRALQSRNAPRQLGDRGVRRRSLIRLPALIASLAYTTAVSQQNKSIRVEYSKKHENKTLTSFWQYIGFTDKVHLQCVKLQNKAEYELRFPGQERLLQETKMTGLDVTLHYAGFITYNYKGPLTFYKDPKEPSKKSYKPRKPRKTMYQTDKQHQQAIQEWERSQP